MTCQSEVWSLLRRSFDISPHRGLSQVRQVLKGPKSKQKTPYSKKFFMCVYWPFIFFWKDWTCLNWLETWTWLPKKTWNRSAHNSGEIKHIAECHYWHQIRTFQIPTQGSDIWRPAKESHSSTHVHKKKSDEVAKFFNMVVQLDLLSEAYTVKWLDQKRIHSFQ